MQSKKIDFSDIPALSDRQLSSMRRVGRPTVGDEPRKLIASRLDARILTRGETDDLQRLERFERLERLERAALFSR